MIWWVAAMVSEGPAISFPQPGVTYSVGKVSVYGFVPVAIVRNRTQSVPDKITTQLTGKTAHGDAAFADYAINVGLNYRF